MEKPTPMPSKMRPTMSIQMASAKALMAAPAKKIKPPSIMEIFRPNCLVTHDAKKDATSAAKYKEEVNEVK